MMDLTVLTIDSREERDLPVGFHATYGLGWAGATPALSVTTIRNFVRATGSPLSSSRSQSFTVTVLVMAGSATGAETDIGTETSPRVWSTEMSAISEGVIIYLDRSVGPQDVST